MGYGPLEGRSVLARPFPTKDETNTEKLQSCVHVRRNINDEDPTVVW